MLTTETSAPCRAARLRASAVAFALALPLAACGGSTSSNDPGANGPAGSDASATPGPPPSGGSPPSAGGPPPASAPPPTPSAVCNALPDDGPAATNENVATGPPPATGGAIEDGTYHLTHMTSYTGPGGASGAVPVTFKGTLVVHGGTVEQLDDIGGSDLVRTTSTIATSGLYVTFTETCPGAAPLGFARPYSADGSRLRFYLPSALGTTLVSTWER